MKIYCLGETLVDLIGENKDTLKTTDNYVKKPGGAPTNVAVAASRLEADVKMIATIGKDGFGEFMEEKLEKENIDTKNLRKSQLKTTLAFAVLNENAEPEFSFYRGADEKIKKKQLEDPGKDNILHLGSLPFTDPETSENILNFLKTVKATVSFDPNIREELMTDRYEETLNKIIKHTDIFIGAESEIKHFGGIEKLTKQVNEVLVTKGEKGAELHTENQSYNEKPPKTKVVDTTGAGDALTGAYLAFRNQGKEEALKKSVQAAAQSITSKGAMSALPTKSELK